MKPVRITRQRALQILEQHGFKPGQDTVYNRDGRIIPNTSFNDELGIKPTYLLYQVRAWLGY